jgi:hypothetical protein
VAETIRKGALVPKKKEDLPGTIQRSPAKARRTRAKTHDSAVEQYGEGESLGGVDLYGNSRRQLLERARDLRVRGRSRMTKRELAHAIAARQ